MHGDIYRYIALPQPICSANRLCPSLECIVRQRSVLVSPSFTFISLIIGYRSCLPRRRFYIVTIVHRLAVWLIVRLIKDFAVVLLLLRRCGGGSCQSADDQGIKGLDVRSPIPVRVPHPVSCRVKRAYSFMMALGVSLPCFSTG